MTLEQKKNYLSMSKEERKQYDDENFQSLRKKWLENKGISAEEIIKAPKKSLWAVILSSELLPPFKDSDSIRSVTKRWATVVSIFTIYCIVMLVLNFVMPAGNFFHGVLFKVSGNLSAGEVWIRVSIIISEIIVIFLVIMPFFGAVHVQALAGLELTEDSGCDVKAEEETESIDDEDESIDKDSGDEMKIIDLRSTHSKTFEAFNNLPKLEKVYLADETTDISTNSFINCPQLNTIEINGVVTIAEKAFINCPNLKTIKVKELSSIDNNCFENCGKRTINFIINGKTYPIQTGK